MEVILKQDVHKLGYADDLVTVKDGYARNYLLPRGLAVLATPANKKVLAETLKQRAFKAEKIRKEAEFMAGKIDGLSLKIMTKASEKGTIFGSVNTIAVASALKEQHGIEVDRKKIILGDNHIKELGNYTAEIQLHKEFKVTVNLEVVAEE
ncbi:MAG TPA: 50S ribosomal protein L9 [Bacteroidales bacterium]|jgi:large subunit ribosomal protein L9|nr:50S ribosomal protein L9 [Bacteroidales bacterium]HOS57288.1 50S ribosomal protein L9 [Bacteroidales bacterium]HPY81147.1 50S ribosomal protein L9 [Bacteroidales bacterium]HRR03786.1 50S ribosomal protein L9 [Bacteroidales bacterium]HRT13391.1 50S ribosomal protein L9 [Bacteroidales bacterium]